jgi:glycosyltransferase involved in cell wall biosynthesis
MSQNMLPFETAERDRYGISWLRLKFGLLRSQQVRSFRSADGLIFLSDYARRVVGSQVSLPRRCVIIPHGVEERFRLDRSARPRDDNVIKLVYVSPIDVYKHQWNVAEAVHRVRAHGVPAVLDFIGPAYGPALERLLRVMRRVDPGEAFLRYRGPVPYAHLHEALAWPDVFVFASSCENMPNTLVEGMAAGLPIACSERGPMPEMLGDAGTYFDPESVPSIAAAIERLARDPLLRQRYGDAARVRSQQWSWRRCAADTFEFLSAVQRDFARSAHHDGNNAPPPRAA